MRRSRVVPILFPLILLAVVLAAPGWATAVLAQDASPGAPAEEGAYLPGRLIVGLDPDAALPEAAALQAADALAALDAQVIVADDPCVVTGTLAAGAVSAPTAVQSWQVLPGREEEAIALLSQQPGVRFVVRDVPMFAAQDEVVEPAGADAAASAAAETAYPVDDPLYTSRQWGPQRANFARAWQMLPVSSTLTAITVTVIDSGVDFNHPELAGRLLPGKNYLDPDATANDENGHGTHVSGIIAALINNGQGMAGSAPQVLIDPRKVLNAEGSGSAFNLRYALCDAALDGARVVNMSLQISRSYVENPSSGLYRALKEAVDFAEARGVLLVAAGGNNRFTHEVYYPALFEEVVAVAALTVDNKRPDYGPIGSKVEIAAPGGDAAAPVLSTWPAAASVRQKCGAPVQSGSGWYCGEYGTSMASPYVAGGAALLLSLRPTLTAPEVRAILRETATDVGLDATEQGAGLLNAERAVRRLQRSTLQVTLSGASRSVPYGSAPYTGTLLVSNPSLEPLAVTGTVTGSNWLSITGAGGAVFAATVAYGQPLIAPVLVSPTNLLTGSYAGPIVLTGTRVDGSTVRSTPTVFLGIAAALREIYFPLILLRSVPQPASIAASVPFSWETPISPTIYALTNTESVDVTLPFAFPLSGPAGTGATTYTQARIYADGFVTFPDGATRTIPNPAQNRCLPWSSGGMQGIFGWWTNLNGGAAGAEVLLFRPGADRYVIQYSNMASVGLTPSYRVTFQIVLYQNGDVRLNYQQAPASWSPGLGQWLPEVTVGVQARNGLYRNQVACITSSTRLGVLPQSGQSLLIKSGEVY